MGGQRIFIMLLYYRVKSKSDTCGMSRFVSKMDKLSYSAQMRILILANGSSTFWGREWRQGRKLLSSNHLMWIPLLLVGVTQTSPLSICGDHLSLCMTLPWHLRGTYIGKGLLGDSDVPWVREWDPRGFPSETDKLCLTALHHGVPWGAPHLTNWESTAFTGHPVAGEPFKLNYCVDISDR